MSFSFFVSRKGVEYEVQLSDEDRDLVDNFTWHINAYGYAVRRFSRFSSYLHRDVMGRVVDSFVEVDHINGDRLDCRRENLRHCTHAENQQNISVVMSSTGVRGVSFHRNRFEARGKIKGKAVYLGRFNTLEQAEAAAKAFRAEFMPFSKEARNGT